MRKLKLHGYRRLGEALLCGTRTRQDPILFDVPEVDCLRCQKSLKAAALRLLRAGRATRKRVLREMGRRKRPVFRGLEEVEIPPRLDPKARPPSQPPLILNLTVPEGY